MYMTNVFDYTFNQNSRIGNDFCDSSQENLQNRKSSSYLLTDFKPDCNMKKTINHATSQPNINFSGSIDGGFSSCVVEANSKLLLNHLSRDKERIMLLHRPYLSVPYLGSGPMNPLVESKIQQSELNENKKSLNPSSEECYMKYNNTPLLPNIKSNINNPVHIVEEAADPKWTRGGECSRKKKVYKDL